MILLSKYCNLELILISKKIYIRPVQEMYSIVARLMIKQNLSPDRGQAPGSHTGVTRGLICQRCLTFLPVQLKSILVPLVGTELQPRPCPPSRDDPSDVDWGRDCADGKCYDGVVSCWVCQGRVLYLECQATHQHYHRNLTTTILHPHQHGSLSGRQATA